MGEGYLLEWGELWKILRTKSETKKTQTLQRKTGRLRTAFLHYDTPLIAGGPLASQSINHLHIHYVPRRQDDGLLLPWTLQQKGNV